VIASAGLDSRFGLNPDFARGHRALGETLLYWGEIDDAIAELRRAVELAPQESAMHESLAKALTAKGLTAEADGGNATRAATGAAIDGHDYGPALLNFLFHALIRGCHRSGCGMDSLCAACCGQAGTDKAAANSQFSMGSFLRKDGDRPALRCVDDLERETPPTLLG
jgi:hypothetical protein